MHFDQAAIEWQKQIFTIARSIEDAASAGEFREARGGLRLGGDGMKDVHATNAAVTDEWAQAARYGFDFGKFGHLCSEVQGFRINVCFLALPSAVLLKGA
jgi:hypothetical protein